MTRLSEKRDVQDQLINHLIGIGWNYLPPGDVVADRGENEREPFLLRYPDGTALTVPPGIPWVNVFPAGRTVDWR